MLRFSSRLIVFGVFLAGLFARVTDAQTWRQIGNFPGLNFRCAYFWDTAHGVVAGDNHIFKYNSGSWTESTYPEPTAIFRSLRLLDGKNLYAASGSTCVWESPVDSGATWQLTSAILNADDVFMTLDGVIHGMNLPGIGMMKGTTFAQIDEMDCAAAVDDINHTIYSSDGGITWSNSAPIDEVGGYCMVADPCSGAYYMLSDGPKVVLWKSTDKGNHWTIIHDFVTSAVDVLDGGPNGVLYVQGTSGVFRSLDGGVSFNSIGGPSSALDDRRMFAFGLGDRSLVVMHGGVVWLWDDSLAYAKQHRETMKAATASSSLCDSVPVPVVIGNGMCAGPLTLAVNASGSTPYLRLDSSRSALGHFGAADTVWFEFAPTTVGGQYYSIRLQGHFDDGVTFDTTIMTYLIATAPDTPRVIGSSGKMTACSELRLPVIIKSPSCIGWRIDSIGRGFPFLGSPEPFDSILTPDQNDTIWFDFNLFEAGTNTMSVGFYLSSPYVHSFYDTTASLSILVGSDNIIPRIITPGVLSVANCMGSQVTLVIQALPCDSVEFTSCTLTLDNSLKYSSNLSFPRTLAPGEADTLLMEFPSQNLNGVYIITAHVIGKYFGSLKIFDTTVQIRVTFTSSPGALAASYAAVDLDTLNICSEGDTLVTFRNLGCDSITVTGDQTVWQPGWSAEDPSFPFTLAPDSSFTVRVHFRSLAPAWSEQLVSYAFKDIGGKAGTSLPFAMTVTAVPATASLSLPDTALDFGTFSRCNASADTTITLRNSGCDSLSLSGAAVGAGSGFTLVNGPDTVLAPNQSVQYKINFADSIAGSLSSALHVHAVGAHGGNAFDTSISFSAKIIAGSHLAALSTQTIDFGTTSICEERDSTVTISNTGCEPDTITRASFLSTQFLLDTTFPIVIAPGAKTIVPISTNLDTTGHPVDVMDTLDFISNLDSALPPVALSRGVIYPGRFSLGLKTEDSAAISAMVPVYVLRKGTIPNTADELDFDLVYNEDLLGYAKAIEPDIQPGNATLLPSGLTERSFSMKPATDRDTIATLEFQSYLAKQQQSPITLTNQKFISGGAISPPCVASIDSGTSAGFTLELACGDGTIVNSLTGLPLELVSMRVSPDALDFTLDRGDATLTSCSAEVLNVLGAQSLQKRLDLSPVTTSSFDLHALPAGAYFLRVWAGRSVISRRFVIVK